MKRKIISILLIALMLFTSFAMLPVNAKILLEGGMKWVNDRENWFDSEDEPEGIIVYETLDDYLSEHYVFYDDPDTIKSEITTLFIIGNNKYDIKDLSGLYEFTNLKQLSIETPVSQEAIQALDFSKLTSIEELNLDGVNINNLALSKLTNLKYLNILNSYIGDGTTNISESDVNIDLDLRRMPKLNYFNYDIILNNEWIADYAFYNLIASRITPLEGYKVFWNEGIKTDSRIPFVSFFVIEELSISVSTFRSKYETGEEVPVIVNWSKGIQATDYILQYDASKLEFIGAAMSEDYYCLEGEGEISVSWASFEEEDVQGMEFTFKAISEGDAEIRVIPENAATGDLDDTFSYNAVGETIKIIPNDYVKAESGIQVDDYLIEEIKTLKGFVITENKITIQDMLAQDVFEEDVTVKVFNEENTEISDTTSGLGTGTIIRLYKSEQLVAEYGVIIYGDVSGDGEITALDALTIIKARNKKIELTGIHIHAGLVFSEKGPHMPSAIDALAIIKHLNNKYEIQQS